MKVLNENRECLRGFLENAPAGFHVLGPNDQIIDVNQTELDMTGYKREDVVGRKKWTDLIVPGERPLFVKYRTALSKTGKSFTHPFTLRHKSGKSVCVLLYTAAQFDESKKLLNTKGFMVDMTVQKELEIQLESSCGEMRKEVLSLTEKNSALNDLLARLEIEKKKIHQNIGLNLDRVILPLFNQLRGKATEIDRKHLDLLENGLKDLTSDFGGRMTDRRWKLTGREIEICNMIKSGLSTKQIADLLNVSSRTIDNHRHNIRKKLDITRDDVDLAGYLKSLA